MKFKNSLNIKGSHSLIKAFTEELQGLGYTPYQVSSKPISISTFVTKEACSASPAYNALDNYYKGFGESNLKSEGRYFTDLELPRDWEKALNLAKETLEEVPEYVEVLPGYFVETDQIGKIYKTSEPFPTHLKCCSNLTWGKELEKNKDNKYFKPSTKEAYDKQQTKTLVIGDKDYKINISKGKVFLENGGGEPFDIMLLNNILHPIFRNCTEKINSYKVQFKKFNTIEQRIIKIGCSWFSPKEISDVVNLYNKINS